MVLFTGNSLKVIVPFARVFKILQINSSITIQYEGGEYTWLDNGQYVPKLDEVTVRYDSLENATAAVRDFYKALENGKKVFYFGGD